MSLHTVYAEARPVLVRLALTSTVGAGSTQAGGHRTAESSRPTGIMSPAERYAALIASAASEREARSHLQAAREELQAILRKPLAQTDSYSRAELEHRIVTDGVGMAAIDVAVMCKCTVSMVRQARVSNARDPSYGKSLEGVSRERWAQELRGAGYSLRQVSALTGIPRSTVHRLTG